MERKERRSMLCSKNLGYLLLLICIFLFSGNLFAQTGFGDSEVQDLPIDGGVSLLVAAGVGYGVKKLYRRNKEK